jgi:alkylhydroperoxidase family enzyme
MVSTQACRVLAELDHLELTAAGVDRNLGRLERELTLQRANSLAGASRCVRRVCRSGAGHTGLIQHDLVSAVVQAIEAALDHVTRLVAHRLKSIFRPCGSTTSRVVNVKRKDHQRTAHDLQTRVIASKRFGIRADQLDMKIGAGKRPA